MHDRQTITDVILCEGTTGVLTFQLTDEYSAPLPLADLTTCLLTLYELQSGGVINGRNRMDIVNTNGGTIDAGGALELVLAIADNAMRTELRTEWHIALLEWTWENETKAGKKEIAFRLANMR